jgi:hypothetical protein
MGREDEVRHRQFVAGLASGERLLMTLRDELYEGSWDKMLGDLRDRLAKRPYIFKLSSRIESDIAAIEKLSAYERAAGVNLAEYLAGQAGEESADEGEAER